ncbi:uncharacterized protein LOC101894899 isoform X2 [Musca domestica]|uniref:Uncharacterized protein LOC101894899 isoform X2 n=1 Tax=Musca domestica TaxID=7370 RepID=A0A1I8MCT7_MUSDO|nr:uncharacterized protein LOC101894899 isoform X2 [Musca domestica]
MTDAQYEAKFQEMQKYLPFIQKVIEKLKVNNDQRKDNPRKAQLEKMEMLHGLLTNKAKKLKMETLLKCEGVLIKLHTKIEKSSIFQGEDIANPNKVASKPSTSTSSSSLSSNTSKKNEKVISSAPASPSPDRLTGDNQDIEPVVIPTERRSSQDSLEKVKPALKSSEEKSKEHKSRANDSKIKPHHPAAVKQQPRPLQKQPISRDSPKCVEQQQQQRKLQPEKKDVGQNKSVEVRNNDAKVKSNNSADATTPSLNRLHSVQSTTHGRNSPQISEHRLNRDSHNHSTMKHQQQQQNPPKIPNTPLPSVSQTVKVVITEPLPASIAQRHFPPYHQHRYQQQPPQHHSPPVRNFNNIEIKLSDEKSDEAYNPDESWEKFNEEQRNKSLKNVFKRLGDKIPDDNLPSSSSSSTARTTLPKSSPISIPIKQSASIPEVLKSPPLSAYDINNLFKESGGDAADISEIGSRRPKKMESEETLPMKNSLDFVRQKLAQIAKIGSPQNRECNSPSTESKSNNLPNTNHPVTSGLTQERLALKYNPHPRQERLQSLSSNEGSECSQMSATKIGSNSNDPRIKLKMQVSPSSSTVMPPSGVNVLPAINSNDPRLKRQSSVNTVPIPSLVSSSYGPRNDPRIARQFSSQSNEFHTKRLNVSQPHVAPEENRDSEPEDAYKNDARHSIGSGMAFAGPFSTSEAVINKDPRNSWDMQQRPNAAPPMRRKSLGYREPGIDQIYNANVGHNRDMDRNRISNSGDLSRNCNSAFTPYPYGGVSKSYTMDSSPPPLVPFSHSSLSGSRFTPSINDSKERMRYFESKKSKHHVPRTYREFKEAKERAHALEAAAKERAKALEAADAAKKTSEESQSSTNVKKSDEPTESAQNKISDENSRRDEEKNKNKTVGDKNSKTASEKSSSLKSHDSIPTAPAVKAGESTLDKMYRTQNFNASQFPKATLSFKIPKKKTAEELMKEKEKSQPCKDNNAPVDKNQNTKDNKSFKNSAGQKSKNKFNKSIENEDLVPNAPKEHDEENWDDEMGQEHIPNENSKEKKNATNDEKPANSRDPRCNAQKKKKETDKDQVIEDKNKNVTNEKNKTNEPKDTENENNSIAKKPSDKHTNSRDPRCRPRDIKSTDNEESREEQQNKEKSTEKEADKNTGEAGKQLSNTQKFLEQTSTLSLFSINELMPKRIMQRRCTMVSIGSAPLVDKDSLLKANALMLEDVEQREKLKRQKEEDEKQIQRRNKNLAEMFRKTDDNCTVSTQNIITGKRRTRATINFNETENARKVFKHLQKKDESNTPPSSVAKTSKSRAKAKTVDDAETTMDTSKDGVLDEIDSNEETQEENKAAEKQTAENKEEIAKSKLSLTKAKKPVVRLSSAGNKKCPQVSETSSAKSPLEDELPTTSKNATTTTSTSANDSKIPSSKDEEDHQICTVSSTSAELPNEEQVTNSYSAGSLKQEEADDNEPSSSGSKSNPQTPTPQEDETSRQAFLDEFVQEIIKPNADKTHILSLLEQILSEDKLQIIKSAIESTAKTRTEEEESSIKEDVDEPKKRNITKNKNQRTVKKANKPLKNTVETDDDEEEEEEEEGEGEDHDKGHEEDSPKSSKSGRNTPSIKKKRNELERLNDDIRDMFICEGVLTATGKRMCTLMNNQNNEKAETTNKRFVQPATPSDANENNNKRRSGRLKPPATAVEVAPKQRQPLRRSLRGNTKTAEQNEDDDTETINSNDTSDETESMADETANPETTPTRRKMPVLKPNTPIKLPEEVEVEKLKQDNNGNKRKAANKPCPKSKKLKSKNNEPVKSEDIEASGSEDENEDDEANSSATAAALDVIRNTNVHWHNQSKYTNWCMLCDKRILAKGSSFHYKLTHGECYISRFAPVLAEKYKQGNLCRPMFGVDRGCKAPSWFHRCPFCLLYFNTTIALWLEHFQNHTAEFRYECSKCHWGNNRPPSIKRHIAGKCKAATVVHSVVKLEVPTVIKAYVCHLCNFLQLKRPNLERHYVEQHLLDPKNADLLGYTITMFDCTDVERVSEEEQTRELIAKEEKVIDIEVKEESSNNSEETDDSKKEKEDDSEGNNSEKETVSSEKMEDTTSKDEPSLEHNKVSQAGDDKTEKNNMSKTENVDNGPTLTADLDEKSKEKDISSESITDKTPKHTVETIFEKNTNEDKTTTELLKIVDTSKINKDAEGNSKTPTPEKDETHTPSPLPTTPTSNASTQAKVKVFNKTPSPRTTKVAKVLSPTKVQIVTTPSSSGEMPGRIVASMKMVLDDGPSETSSKRTPSKENDVDPLQSVAEEPIFTPNKPIHKLSEIVSPLKTNESPSTVRIAARKYTLIFDENNPHTLTASPTKGNTSSNFDCEIISEAYEAKEIQDELLSLAAMAAAGEEPEQEICDPMEMQDELLSLAAQAAAQEEASNIQDDNNVSTTSAIEEQPVASTQQCPTKMSEIVSNTIDLIFQSNKRKSDDAVTEGHQDQQNTNKKHCPSATINDKESSVFVASPIAGEKDSSDIKVLASSIVSIDNHAEEQENTKHVAATTSIAERLSQRLKDFENEAKNKAKPPANADVSPKDQKPEEQADIKEKLEEKVNIVESSQSRASPNVTVISDDEWEDIEVTESAPNTNSSNQKSKNKGLFQKFGLFKPNASKSKKHMAPIIFYPKKKPTKEKTVQPHSNSSSPITTGKSMETAATSSPVTQLGFKSVINIMDDLLPDSPCNDPIDLVPELRPLEPLTDLNDISSILDSNLSVMGGEASIQIDESHTCIQDALDFITEQATQGSESSTLPDSLATGAKTPRTKRIENVGYSKKDGAIKFYCLLENCSFLFSSDAMGLENHFLCEHSQMKWKGYCDICQSQCFPNDQEQTIRQEIKHMVDEHANKPQIEANSDSSQGCATTLGVEERPRIKLRRMTGDCLSTSNSESPTHGVSVSTPPTANVEQPNSLLGALLNAKPKPPTKEMPPQPEMPLTEPLLIDDKITNVCSDFLITSVTSAALIEESPLQISSVVSLSEQNADKDAPADSASPLPKISNVCTLSAKSAGNLWAQQIEEERQELMDAAAASLEVSNILANARTPTYQSRQLPSTADSPEPIVVAETVPVAQATTGNFVITQTVSTQYGDDASSAAVGFNISIEASALTNTASANTAENIGPSSQTQSPLVVTESTPPLQLLSIPSVRPSNTPSLTSRQYKCMANGCKFSTRVPVAMSDHLRFHERRNLTARCDYFACGFCMYQASDVEDYMKHCDQYHIIGKGNKPPPGSNDQGSPATTNICDILSRKMETTNAANRNLNSLAAANVNSAAKQKQSDEEYLQKLRSTIEEIVAPTGLPDDKLYRCVVKNCRTQLTEATFHNHIIFHISTLGLSNPNNYIFKCPHCTAQYHRPAGIKAHIKNHARNRYFCYLCEETSANAGQMLKHFSERHWHTLNLFTKELLKAKVVTNPDGTEQIQDSCYYLVYTQELSESEVRTYGEKLILEWQRKKSGSKTHFKSTEIDLLPITPIFQREINCGECEYKTKVRTNMYRHLLMHKQNPNLINNSSGQAVVASVDPVNPVPCLNSNEKFFDKMTNLASSSLIPQSSSLSSAGSKNAYKIPQAFVVESNRFKCGIPDCNYVTISEDIFRSHLSTLHGAVQNYRCPFCQEEICKRGMAVDRVIGHLRFHTSTIYRCDECNYIHYQRYVVERHANEKHATMKVNIIRYDRSAENAEGVMSITPFAGKKYKESIDTNQANLTTSSATTPTTALQTNENTSSASAKSSKGKSWNCDVCKFKASTLTQIQNHCQNAHGQSNPYQCIHCQFGSQQLVQVLHHIDDVHAGKARNVRNIYHRNNNDAAGDAVDTRPLWQRNDPTRIRHIRGILMEDEEESEKHRKSLGLDKVADDEDDEAEDDEEETSHKNFIKGYEFGCQHCQYKCEKFDILYSDHHRNVHSLPIESTKPFMFRLLNRVCCPVCRKFTGNFYEMQVHLLNVHFTRNYYAADISIAETDDNTQRLVCGYCTTFHCSKPDQLMKHFRGKEGHAPQDVNIKNMDHLADILKLGGNETYYQCTLCFQLFGSRVAIVQHAITAHANDEGFSFKELNKEIIYQCPFCHHSSTTEIDLLRHMTDHYGNFKRCTFCLAEQVSFERCMQHCYAEHREEISRFKEIYPLHTLEQFWADMFVIFPNGLVISKKNLKNTKYGDVGIIHRLYEDLYKISQQPPIPRLSIARLVARKSIETHHKPKSGNSSPQYSAAEEANIAAPQPQQPKKIAKRRCTVISTSGHSEDINSGGNRCGVAPKRKPGSVEEHESSSNQSSEFNMPSTTQAMRIKKRRCTIASDNNDKLPTSSASSSSSPSPFPSPQHYATDDELVVSKKSKLSIAPAQHNSPSLDLEPFSYYGIKPESIDLSKIYTKVAIGGINTPLTLDKFRLLFNIDCRLKLTKVQCKKDDNDNNTVPNYLEYKHVKKACPASHKMKFS